MWAYALDVQNIGRRLRRIWDRVGIGIIMMHRRSSKGSGSGSNENRNVHIIDNIHGYWNCYRPSDRHRNLHLNRVSHYLRNSNGHRNLHLHWDRALNLLCNHHVIRTWNWNRDCARNAHTTNHSHWSGNRHLLHLSDRHGHRLSLSNCVRRVDLNLLGFDNFNRDRYLYLLDNITHSLVRLRNTHLLWDSLGLINWHLYLVRNHLVDRNYNLNWAGNSHLINNLHRLRNINCLGLSDFNWIRSVDRNSHRHSI